MDIHKLIDDLRGQGAKISLVVELPAQEPPTPPPPAPPQTANFRIIAGTANARCVKEYNKAGYPIMEIYPSDTSSPETRKQYHFGDIVKINSAPVRADGGYTYYEIAEPTGIPVRLYLRWSDGSIELGG